MYLKGETTCVVQINPPGGLVLLGHAYFSQPDFSGKFNLATALLYCCTSKEFSKNFNLRVRTRTRSQRWGHAYVHTSSTQITTGAREMATNDTRRLFGHVRTTGKRPQGVQVRPAREYRGGDINACKYDPSQMNVRQAPRRHERNYNKIGGKNLKAKFRG